MMRQGFVLWGLLCVASWFVGCSSDDSSSGDSASSGSSSSSGGSASSTTTTAEPTTTTDSSYGESYSGQYHLGPVDFAETEWHNACAPGGGYASALQQGTGLGGEYLAGVQTGKINDGANCDACLQITTATGRTIVARVVTYGDTGENDLDVSPSVYEALNTDEYPRTMSWTWAECPDTGTLRYEFQTEANAWWTSFWVRNQRVPVTKVEVQSANHPEYFELRRELDGTLNDDGGFGEGAFTLRLTGADGQVIEDRFDGFAAGELIISTKQFE